MHIIISNKRTCKASNESDKNCRRSSQALIGLNAVKNVPYKNPYYVYPNKTTCHVFKWARSLDNIIRIIKKIKPHAYLLAKLQKNRISENCRMSCAHKHCKDSSMSIIQTEGSDQNPRFSRPMIWTNFVVHEYSIICAKQHRNPLSVSL